jgi:hypothetical protein
MNQRWPARCKLASYWPVLAAVWVSWHRTWPTIVVSTGSPRSALLRCTALQSLPHGYEFSACIVLGAHRLVPARWRRQLPPAATTSQRWRLLHARVPRSAGWCSQQSGLHHGDSCGLPLLIDGLRATWFHMFDGVAIPHGLWVCAVWGAYRLVLARRRFPLHAKDAGGPPTEYGPPPAALLYHANANACLMRDVVIFVGRTRYWRPCVARLRA